MKGSVGRSLRFSVTVDEEMLYVAVPIEKDGKVLGVIRMSAFSANQQPYQQHQGADISGGPSHHRHGSPCCSHDRAGISTPFGDW